MIEIATALFLLALTAWLVYLLACTLRDGWRRWRRGAPVPVCDTGPQGLFARLFWEEVDGGND